VDVIRPNKLIQMAVFTVFILSLCFIIPPASGQNSIDNYVDATFDIELRSSTDFKISVDMDVNKITAFETVYTKTDIQNLASSSIPDDAYTLGGIMLILHDLLKNQTQTTFKNANVVPLNTKPTYKDSLFHEEYNVNLTSSFFGVNDSINIYDFINGVLDMGAILDYDFNLYAKKGWNNTYIINLGEKFDYTSTNGKVDEDTIEWIVRNGNGNQPSISADLLIKDSSPTTTYKTQDIFLEFELDARNKKTSLISNIQASSIDISPYNVLPGFITNLTHVSSDGVRLFIANNLISTDTFYENTLQPIEEKIISTIESSIFNQTLDTIFSWDETTTTDLIDPYDANNMNDDPPITGVLTDNDVNLLLYKFPIRATFGLVNSGARANVSEGNINFGDALYKIGYPYRTSLFMPKDVLLGKNNVFTWNDTIAFSGEFISNNATEYSGEDIKKVVEIEIKSTDLNLLSFFTGHTELTFGMYLDEKSNYNLTSLPEEFTLPEKISLNYLNSDAFRLCIDEGLFSQENINDFLTSEKLNFERRMGNIIQASKVKGNTNRETFENSLEWDGDINEMSGDSPVKTHSYAHISHPVYFVISIVPPSIKIPTQMYNFSSIQDQTVTYRMIFPSGIHISATDAKGLTEVKETSDGKEYFELTLTPEDEGSVIVSCDITPSALFLIGLFTPCIISVFITILLIALLLILRKKRRKRKKGAPVIYDEPLEEESTDYEEEDYYIPPPPGSK
jgi:hypothetical protein